MSVVLKDLLLDSKDGEWGKGEASADSVAMLAIRGTDFDDVRIGFLSSVPIRHIPQRIAARKSLRPLDIVFETAGGSKDRPTGRSVLLKPSLFDKTDLPVTCASFARFLRIDPTKADPEFIFWLLQDMYNSGVLKQYHTQHTGVARYQYTTFAENERLKLPGQSTQRRIASILSAYDDLIENNTRRIGILEEMARRIYEEWFVRFRFPGHENVRMVESELGPVPDGWTLTTLKEVCVPNNGIQTGPFGSQLHKSDYSDEGVPVLMPKDLIGFRIETATIARIPEELADRLARHRMKPGDIVYGRRGDIGRRAYIMPNQTGWFCGTGCLRIRPDASRINGWYVFNFIGQENVVGLIAGRAHGVTMANLNARLMESIPVLCPPTTLQDRYQEVTFPMISLREKLSALTENLRSTRDLLLPKLISGELDVSSLPKLEAAVA